MKQYVYSLLEKGETASKNYNRVSTFIIALIILNAVAMVFESIHEIMIVFGDILHLFDLISVAIFTVEYVLRLYISDLTHPANTKFGSIIRFMTSWDGIIDLLAILPFYLPMLIKLDLRELRLLRLFRFFRLLKIHRYNTSVNIILDVFKEKRTELGITGLLALITVTIAAMLMYHVEGPVQPEAFPDILSAFWWAVATLTAVGYGDIYPVTGIGRFIAGVIALVGIGLVALPTGLISVGFLEKIKERKKHKHCPHCGKELPH
ncbi:ion transporter [bacterium]|nr:ion transporter [bacterium]